MPVVSSVYDRLIAVDTSAIIALLKPTEQHHQHAVDFFQDANTQGLHWHALNATTHELYTRVRYDHHTIDIALSYYDYLRAQPFRPLQFIPEDETEARGLLGKYPDQTLSYHDALCAAVMFRLGIYKIFTFDSHFYVFGFEIYPGQV